MKKIIKESEIRNFVRSLIRKTINESRSLQSPKLYNILQQHGGFDNSQKQFPEDWNLSKQQTHSRRKPLSGNYSNLSDNDIIGVISAEERFHMDDKSLRQKANEMGLELNGADEVSNAKLSDGNYLIYVDRNSNNKNSAFNKDNGGWNDYYSKKQEREHNRNADGKNQYLPTTDRSQAAKDLRDNPYYWSKEGSWKDPNERNKAMDRVRNGQNASGGPVWRYYNGKAQNDKGTYDEQYGINEAMMDGFSFDELKNMSFTNKIKYCTQMCGKQIGGGSSRIVFQIDDQWVLKLARNQKGIAQNEEEYRIATDGYGTSLSVKVDQNRSDTDGYAWIVSEFVLPAKVQDFKKCYGIDWKDVMYFARHIKYGDGIVEDIYEKYYDNEDAMDLLNELHEYYANWNGAMGDCVRIVNWGLTNRNGSPELVLLDTGASMDIINRFYK